MNCRSCGTEIADKALICYRCGIATTEARYKAPAPAPRRASSSTLVTMIVALVGVILLALNLDRIASGQIPPAVSYAIAAAAAVLLLVRVLLRQRR